MLLLCIVHRYRSDVGSFTTLRFQNRDRSGFAEVKVLLLLQIAMKLCASLFWRISQRIRGILYRGGIRITTYLIWLLVHSTWKLSWCIHTFCITPYFSVDNELKIDGGFYQSSCCRYLQGSGVQHVAILRCIGTLLFPTGLNFHVHKALEDPCTGINTEHRIQGDVSRHPFPIRAADLCTLIWHKHGGCSLRSWMPTCNLCLLMYLRAFLFRA